MRIPNDYDMGPPLRRPGPCWNCAHTKIVRCQVREESFVKSRTILRRLPLTRGVTTKTAEGPRGTFEQAVVFHIDRPHGLLEAYACQRCGYVEWFAEKPEEIPIGAEYGTELLDYDEEEAPADTERRGPYR